MPGSKKTRLHHQHKSTHHNRAKSAEISNEDAAKLVLGVEPPGPTPSTSFAASSKLVLGVEPPGPCHKSIREQRDDRFRAHFDDQGGNDESPAPLNPTTLASTAKPAAASSSLGHGAEHRASKPAGAAASKAKGVHMHV